MLVRIAFCFWAGGVCEGVCPATQNNKTGQTILAAGRKSEDTQMSNNTFNEVPFYLIAKKFL